MAAPESLRPSQPVPLRRRAPALIAAVITVVALAVVQAADPLGASRAGEAGRLRQVEALVDAGAWSLAARHGGILLDRHYSERRVHWLLSRTQRGNGLMDIGLQHLVVASASRDSAAVGLFADPTEEELRREAEAYASIAADSAPLGERGVRLVRVYAALRQWDAVRDRLAAPSSDLSEPTASQNVFAAALLGTTPEDWRRLGLPTASAASLCVVGGAVVVSAGSLGPTTPEIGVLAGGASTGGQSLVVIGGRVLPTPADVAWRFVGLDAATGALLDEIALDLSGPSGHDARISAWLETLPESVVIVGTASDAATHGAPAGAREALRQRLGLEAIPSTANRLAYAFLTVRSSGSVMSVHATAQGPDWPAMLLCVPEQ